MLTASGPRWSGCQGGGSGPLVPSGQGDLGKKGVSVGSKYRHTGAPGREINIEMFVRSM